MTAVGTAGNGPAYFSVQTPDGHTLQYGNGGNSQVLAYGTSTALTWMLNQVSDTAGNTMTISYTTATGTAVPSTISWTPTSHGASTYSYTMVFGYGTNVLPTAGYVAGTPVQNPELLGTITINYNGSQVKQYILTYQQSGTTVRDLLTQVQECSTSTSNCLQPTTISYQPGAAGVTTSATTAVSSPIGSCAGWGGSVARYDFNGDGYSDLLYYSGNTCYVQFGSASGYGAPVSTGISGAAVTNMLAGDLLGTGKAGLLANNGGTWYYYTWNGSSFVGTSTGLAYDSTAIRYVLADINGDGLPDLVALYGPSAVRVTTRLNTSSGTTPSFSASAVTAFTDNPQIQIGLISPDDQPGNLRFFDFDGDGRQDIAIQEYNCAYYYMGGCMVYLNTIKELISQTGGTFVAVQLLQSPNASILGVLTFANVNNDACTDAIYAQQYVGIAACNGNAAVTVSAAYPIVAVMDWNGDGLADLIENNGGALYVQMANGSGYAAPTATSLAYASYCTYVTFDANGDGLDDLACSSGQSGTAGFAYHLHSGSGHPPDLLSSVTDGYGNSAQPTYVSIVQSNYTIGTSTPQAGYENYIGPLYVVNQTTFSDPSSATGATYQKTFTYYTAWMNLQGRGFGGFNYYQQYDSRSGTYEQFGSDLGFPTGGMFAWDQPSFDQAANQPIRYTFANVVSTTLDSTPYNQRYFVYFNHVTTWEYQVSWNSISGSSSGPLIKTTSTSYSYDNYGNPMTVTQTITDKDSTSPYYNQSWTTATTNTPDVSTSPWCLNLLTQVQMTYSDSLSNSDMVTRTKQFTPDATNCRYTQIVTEPSSASYKVTEALGYDAFGNVNSDTVTGINMAARQTLVSWTSSTVTTGQFPMSVTDPSNTQTQYGYDFRFGLVSQHTSANNLTTSWSYDSFGNKTLESRPDGTSSKWTYNLFPNLSCGTLSACGTLRSVINRFDQDTSQNAIDQAGETLDPVDRVTETYSLNIAGQSATVDTYYDSLGRVASRGKPFLWGNAEYFGTYSYDVLARLTRSQRPISASNSTLQTTSYQYNGRTTIVTDPQSNARTTVTDVNGWLRKTEDAYGYTVTLGYDAAGSKTSTTDSLGHSLWSGTYGYGTGAFLTSESDVDRGAWTYTPDALGEVAAWHDTKNQLFAMTFDALSRPMTRSEPDYFTQWTWGSSAASHNVGQLQSVCTGTGTNPTTCSSGGYAETETYDSFGRRIQRAMAMPSLSTLTYTWGYNATTGLLDTLTYPISTSGYALKLQYGYQHGILQSIKDISDTPNVIVWQANSMNAEGQVTQESLGNGVVTNRAYDAVTYWLSSVQAGVGGGTGIKNLGFLFDEVGNVTQRQDNNLGLTENIFYDNDYRLSTTKLNGTQNLAVNYDGSGNITSRSDVAGGANWTYDAIRKHAVTQAGSSAYQYAYDANGNMSSRQGSAVAWSSYNYPTGVSAGSGSTTESVTFAYGPDRQRWQQDYTGNGATEITDYAGPMEVVLGGGGVDIRHYIYANRAPVAVYSRKSSGVNTFSYLLYDHQGSVATLTNNSGGAVVSESHTPFGNRRNPSTWSGAASNSDLTTSAGITREGYTFQTQLGLWMGMNHMNGRVQDSIIGRFLSADPNIPDASDSQSYNRYSYGRNNPLTSVDPSGFDDFDLNFNALNCQNGGKNCAPVACTGSHIAASCYVGLEWSCARDCDDVNQAYYGLGPSHSSSGGSATTNGSTSGTGGGASPPGTPDGSNSGNAGTSDGGDQQSRGQTVPAPPDRGPTYTYQQISTPDGQVWGVYNASDGYLFNSDVLNSYDNTGASTAFTVPTRAISQNSDDPSSPGTSQFSINLNDGHIVLGPPPDVSLPVPPRPPEAPPSVPSPQNTLLPAPPVTMPPPTFTITTEGQVTP
jgi:RHS repeat-associated protein